MITYKIHLIRTGRTNDESIKRYVGQSETPLCESGIADLKEFAEEFRYPKVEMVYTSPLARCVQTADILFPNLYTVNTDGLMDMNLGSFQGKSFDDLKGDPAFASWLNDSINNTPPGGEPVVDFTRRVILGINNIFDKMMEEGVTSVAAVTHGGVIMTLLSSICLPKAPMHHWAVDNGFGFTILMTPQMWMRDRMAEVFAAIPEPLGKGEDEEYAFFE